MLSDPDFLKEVEDPGKAQLDLIVSYINNQ